MLNRDDIFHLMILKNQQSYPTKIQSFLNINPRKDCINSLIIIDFISLCWWLYQQSFNDCRWRFNKTKPWKDDIIWIKIIILQFIPTLVRSYSRAVLTYLNVNQKAVSWAKYQIIYFFVKRTIWVKRMIAVVNFQLKIRT